MSRVDSLGGPAPESEVEEVEVVATCSRCWYQADVVFYNRSKRLLFWECPNGHKDFVEEFDYVG